MTAALGRAALVALGLSLLAGVLMHPSARAELAATTLLDVTFECAVPLRGGAYILDARAHAGTRLQARWAKLPYVGVRAGNFGGESGNMLAWVTSGTPTSTTTIDHEFETFHVKAFGTIGVRREPCRRTSKPVPLTASGLKGGVAAPLGTEYECFGPRRVLIRIRAVLGTPGTLRRGAVFQTLHAPVHKVKLAVRTLAGKQLIYADATQSGRARLFTARGCTPR